MDCGKHLQYHYFHSKLAARKHFYYTWSSRINLVNVVTAQQINSILLIILDENLYLSECVYTIVSLLQQIRIKDKDSARESTDVYIEVDRVSLMEKPVCYCLTWS